SQIDGIIKHGSPTENFPIRSDLNGVVLKKRANPGDYINQGASLFEVANLSKIWILFDIYESDIQWVKKRDEVEFTIQSLPGEKFKGKISFIDPVINPKTRVAKARMAMNNPGQRLKPEMFARGVLKSPMKDSKPSIIIPKSAIMWTGERSVVYVKTSSATSINFIMREVTLGPSLGDSYIITEGLEEGEEIATNGTFSIDAAAQLAGKPSMMNPKGGMVMTAHNHGGSSGDTNSNHVSHSEFVSISKDARQALGPLFEQYIILKDALVSDDFKNSISAGKSLQQILEEVNMSIFTGEAHNIWMKHSSIAKEALTKLTKAKDIDSARTSFIVLSDQFIMLAKTFNPIEQTMYLQHCPMANSNKGADWLSMDKDIRNPYFGESMLTCGEVTQEIN
ncbi:MAG: efflux RND transporter periplasmic adaptor subunit, partial [Cyclobacteriaceae bacterium]|nr:efflux RND transporter periplasmic adaptor subunit [Cyclobacteriaceae bacterium]